VKQSTKGPYSKQANKDAYNVNKDDGLSGTDRHQNREGRTEEYRHKHDWFATIPGRGTENSILKVFLS